MRFIVYRTFTGITDMPYGNIADDLARYFRQSEQRPTCFANHVAFNENDEVVACRSIMAQLRPGGDEDLLGHIREILHHHPWQEANIPVRELPALLFDDAETMSIGPIQASCGCSREMFYLMLTGLAAAELREAVAQNRVIDVVCHACGCKYSFAPEEVPGLIPRGAQ